MLNLIFKTNEHKILMLLNQLSSENPKQKTDLCESLAVSRPTLDRYVSQLNDYYQDQFKTSQPVIINTGQTLQIDFNSPENQHLSKNILIIKKVQSDLAHSYEYLILNYLVKHRHFKLSELLTEINISEVYYNQILARLKAFLKHYNITIKTKRGNIGLEGSLQNILLFSYLFSEMHDKLFSDGENYNDDKKIEIERYLTDHTISDLNDFQQFRANTLYNCIRNFLPELENYTIEDPDVKLLLELLYNETNLFSPEINDMISNPDALAFINFLVLILFSQVAEQNDHLIIYLNILEKLNSEVPEIIAQSEEISQHLLDSIGPTSKKDALTFNYTTLVSLIYLKLFSSDMKSIFKATQLTEDAKDTSPKSTLQANISSDLIKTGISPSYAKLLLDNIDFFEELTSSFYRKTRQTQLYIVLDFQTKLSYEYYLKERLSELFKPDTIVFHNDARQADLVVSDQLHAYEEPVKFYYYANIEADKDLQALCRLISDIYLEKLFQKK